MAANSVLTNIFQESDTCKQCQQTVGEVNSICCDICNTWYHLKCTKISLKQFKSIFLADTCTWYCNFCLHEALPFSSINYNSLEKLSCPTKAQKYISKMISRGVQVAIKKLLTNPNAFHAVTASVLFIKNVSMI